jgi:hypothetical protein
VYRRRPKFASPVTRNAATDGVELGLVLSLKLLGCKLFLFIIQYLLCLPAGLLVKNYAFHKMLEINSDNFPKYY